MARSARRRPRAGPKIHKLYRFFTTGLLEHKQALFESHLVRALGATCFNISFDVLLLRSDQHLFRGPIRRFAEKRTSDATAIRAINRPDCVQVVIRPPASARGAGLWW